MDLQLSWDLFILVFFAIVVAYSFILGRTATLKIIIASYIATLSADGVGNIFKRIIVDNEFFERVMGFIGYTGSTAQMGDIFKILLFITIIVLLTIFGDYTIEEPPEENPFYKFSMLILISVLSGGLILSTIIVFANGGSLIDGTATISDEFVAIYQQSRLVRNLLDWHDAWFAAPGLAFVVVSIFQKNKAA